MRSAATPRAGLAAVAARWPRRVASAGCDVKMAADGDLSVDIWHGQAQDTWDRSYTVAPGGRLEIINVNGEIRGRGVHRRPPSRCRPSARVRPAPTSQPRTSWARSRCARKWAPSACAWRPVAPRVQPGQPQGHLRRQGAGRASTSTCAPSTAACGSRTSAGKCGPRRPTAACAAGLAAASLVDARTDQRRRGTRD